MADCPRVVFPTCGQTGQGFTREPINAGQTEIHLMVGHGKNFPIISGNQFFFVTVFSGCGQCCETMKVVQRADDILVVERPQNGRCGCIKSNATVVYAHNSLEHLEAVIRGVGLEVEPPLHYDACARKLWIDCEELKQLIQRPCGG